MSAWLKIILEVLLVFAEWFKWVFEPNDVEFEEISKAWPAPIKTRLARLRYEAKLREKSGEADVHMEVTGG